MARYIAGGLLSGLGGGMIAQAEDRRQAALERARLLAREQERTADRAHQTTRDQENQAFQMERDEVTHGRATERDQANREWQGGLLSNIDTDDEGNRIAVSRDMTTTPLGYRGATDRVGTRGRSGTGGGEAGGFDLSADEQRMLERLEAQHTSVDTGRPNRNEVVAELRALAEDRGDARLREIADNYAGGVDRVPPRMSREEAEQEARSEARGKQGMFKRNSSVFPETGGDVEAWVQMRTQELMGGEQRGLIQRPGASNQPTDAESGATPAAGASEYDSAEAVREAFRRGDIDREMAMEILRSQFEYQ